MKKKIFFDVVLNIVATSIPTVVLQLLILPSLSNYMSDDSYGIMVTILAVFNVVPATIGTVLNNIRLLHEEEYRKDNEQGDFQILLVAFQSISVIIITVVSCYYLGIKDVWGILFAIMASIPWLGRQYYIVAFRLKLDYIAVLVNNLCLIVGHGIGYVLFRISGYWQLIYLFGYILGCVHIMLVSPILKEPFRMTKRFKIVLKGSSILLISNVLTNSINYADKILLYPLMGGAMVSVYYAATVFSKVVGLIILPLNGVVLSYFSKMNKKNDALFKWTYTVGIIICIIGYFATVLLSGPVLGILYPKYADAAMKYIWVTSATTVMSVLISMVSPFVLRFFDVKWQIWINGITTVSYILIAFVLFKLWGLMGFCVGTLIANIIKLLATTFVYIHRPKGTVNNNDNPDTV